MGLGRASAESRELRGSQRSHRSQRELGGPLPELGGSQWELGGPQWELRGPPRKQRGFQGIKEGLAQCFGEGFSAA